MTAQEALHEMDRLEAILKDARAEAEELECPKSSEAGEWPDATLRAHYRHLVNLAVSVHKQVSEIDRLYEDVLYS